MAEGKWTRGDEQHHLLLPFLVITWESSSFIDAHQAASWREILGERCAPLGLHCHFHYVCTANHTQARLPRVFISLPCSQCRYHWHQQPVSESQEGGFTSENFKHDTNRGKEKQKKGPRLFGGMLSHLKITTMPTFLKMLMFLHGFWRSQLRSVFHCRCVLQRSTLNGCNFLKCDHYRNIISKCGQ